MKIIALFFPAFIAMSIKKRRGTWKYEDIISTLGEYGKLVLWCNLITISIITYIIRIDQVTGEAFNSFPFFSKYVFMSMTCAFFIPYIQEYVNRYIQIRFFEKEENKKI